MKRIREGGMAFGMYRPSTMGVRITETLDEMVSSGRIIPELAVKVQLQFDKSISAALEQLVTSSRASFKGNLHTYRYCDSVWTLILRDVRFSNEAISGNIANVMIVACDPNLMKPKEPPQQ